MRTGLIEVAGRSIAVSNTDKLLYPSPSYTKGDVLDYYRDVATMMLPHLRGRPLTLRRFPDGIDQDGFYQKDASDYFPKWIRTAAVLRRAGDGAVDHVVCDDAATLIYLANQACLEFHAWPSRVDALDRPDRLIIDLDPPDGADLGAVRGAARQIRDLLTDLELVPFVQTTGGSGFHVVAPLDREAGYDLVHPLAHDLAAYVAASDPEQLTVEQRKSQRAGRIFLDTNRNAYGQMAIVAYSLRARPGAPVATPIDWAELGRVEPGTYHLGNVRRRLAQKADPWASLDHYARSAAKARERLDDQLS